MHQVVQLQLVLPNKSLTSPLTPGKIKIASSLENIAFKSPPSDKVSALADLVLLDLVTHYFNAMDPKPGI